MKKESAFVRGYDIDSSELRYSGWKKPNGARALCYWNSKSNIVTQTYEGTVSIRLMNGDAKDLRIVDLLTGNIYEIPESMKMSDKQFTLLINIPVTDYPMLLTMGDFF